jgi:hypothetical protein
MSVFLSLVSPPMRTINAELLCTLLRLYFAEYNRLRAFHNAFVACPKRRTFQAAKKH